MCCYIIIQFPAKLGCLVINIILVDPGQLVMQSDIACSAGVFMASAQFSVWSSFWFCKMARARRSEKGWGGGVKEKEKTPACKACKI